MSGPAFPAGCPPGFVDLTGAANLALDIRYASTANFTGRDLYGGTRGLLLHAIAAEKLLDAAARLAEARPDLRLLVFDGFRPNRVQRVLWATVEGTPQQRFVADPAIGSIHSYGLAVDLSLVDAHGRELDMGTTFDDFTPRSEPCREADMLARGLLNAGQVANRRVLRDAMEGAGFLPLPTEWWHFDALPAWQVRASFALIE